VEKQLKIALPKGRLLAETAKLLQEVGWGLSGYHEKARSYHLESTRFPYLQARVFHEKDIPVQVTLGNYDLGICGLDWLEELLAKYPSSALVKVRSLGYGEGALYMAASQWAGASTVGELPAGPRAIRIASEYPNLAELFALRKRLKRFSIFPLWGAAEVYPPESADLALITGGADETLFNYDLVPVSKVLDFNAFLVSNKRSWETKDLSDILSSINGKLLARQKHTSPADTATVPPMAGRSISWGTHYEEMTEDTVRLALPDGHQQLPALQLLGQAGIQIDNDAIQAGNRRPATNLAGVTAKAVRPQDMPLQVANGNFDLAITGRDWLMEHLCQFPSSPVKELLDLKFGWVKIVAVVSKELSVTDVYSLRQTGAERSLPLRVASEYVNIADKYARDNHLGMYRVIPTWGASEAFLSEDADLLIENTQTGRTIARHNLKIIDTLFESTACLITNTNSIFSSSKRERMESITEALRKAVGGAHPN
jgi:ATP phosphoribosyltransferase